ncbi:hypothetical protein FKP32DRAFT_1756030, partial [Trametes sanguinea]
FHWKHHQPLLKPKATRRPSPQLALPSLCRFSTSSSSSSRCLSHSPLPLPLPRGKLAPLPTAPAVARPAPAATPRLS